MTKNEVISEASQIWLLLSERKILSVQRIEEMTHYREALVCLALGWLVKENKIRLFEEEGMIHAEIIISIEHRKNLLSVLASNHVQTNHHSRDITFVFHSNATSPYAILAFMC